MDDKRKKERKVCGLNPRSFDEALIKIIQRVQRPNTGKTRFLYP
jgi:hypothetical protein